MKAAQSITSAEVDERFDNSEDISAYVDWSKPRRPKQEARPGWWAISTRRPGSWACPGSL
jgi:hypothetical protein